MITLVNLINSKNFARVGTGGRNRLSQILLSWRVIFLKFFRLCDVIRLNLSHFFLVPVTDPQSWLFGIRIDNFDDRLQKLLVILNTLLQNLRIIVIYLSILGFNVFARLREGVIRWRLDTIINAN